MQTSINQIQIIKDEHSHRLNVIEDDYITNSHLNNYVTQLDISNIIGNAPEALDTLKELADALDNDASFSITVINRFTDLDTSLNDLSNDIQINISSINTSLSNLYGRVNNQDTSINSIDTSLSNLYETVNNQDISISSIDTSLSNLYGIINNQDISISSIDASLSSLDNKIDNIDISNLDHLNVNTIDTSGITIYDVSKLVIECPVHIKNNIAVDGYSLSSQMYTSKMLFSKNFNKTTVSNSNNSNIISFLSRTIDSDNDISIDISDLNTSNNKKDTNITSIFTDISNYGAHNITNNMYTSGNPFTIPYSGLYYFFANINWDLENFDLSGEIHVSIAPDLSNIQGYSPSKYLNSFYNSNHIYQNKLNISVNGVLYCEKGWNMSVFAGHKDKYPKIISISQTYWGGYKL